MRVGRTIRLIETKLLMTSRGSSITQHQTPGGCAYEWLEYKSRGSRLYELRIKTSLAIEFKITKEGFFERLAKKLGMASEFQTNDPTFDDAFYLMCDVPSVCRKLSTAQARKLITHISAHIERMEIADGYVIVRMSAGKSIPDPTITDSLADALAELCDIIGSQMRQDDVEHSRHRTLSHWVSYGFTAMLVVSALSLYLPGYRLTSLHSLLTLAAIIAPPVIIACFLILQNMFRHSSYGVAVFSYFIWLGLGGLFLTVCSAIFWVNIGLDHSDAIVREQIVVSKYTRSGKHRSYYLRASHWNPAQKPLSLSVGRTTYERTPSGSPITFYTHPGTLNMEWIERHEVHAR